MMRQQERPIWVRVWEKAAGRAEAAEWMRESWGSNVRGAKGCPVEASVQGRRHVDLLKKDDSH